MSKYVIVKKVNGFKYYYGRFGKWEGLINNAIQYNLDKVRPIIRNLEQNLPDKEKISHLPINYKNIEG